MAEPWCKGKKLFACLAGVTVCVVFSLLLTADKFPVVVFRQAWTSPGDRKCCSDRDYRSVLSSLLTGRWEQRTMSAEEIWTLETFLQYDREVLFGMPKGLERGDKRCGNVTFEPKPNYEQLTQWFRALCDAEGPTPCCFHNVCLNKTVEECACAHCVDPRTPIHAEYALWRPTDSNCLPLAFSQRELCDLLDNSTIYFIGDSLVRHVHTAMLLTIRNNDKTGAFSDTMPQDVRDKCEGLYMFTEKVCRLHLARDVTACDGRAGIRFIEAAYNNDGGMVKGEILRLKNKPKSLVFIGLGFHNMFDTSETFNKVMKPVLDRMSAENWTWPVLVWASIHSFGILRNPNLLRQQTKDVIRFNREMQALLDQYRHSVPLHIFDAYGLTTNVTSFDGQHYGMGVNKVKVNILMNFIDNMKKRRLW